MNPHLTPALASLPSWRRFAQRAWFVHALVISQLILLPAPTSRAVWVEVDTDGDGIYDSGFDDGTSPPTEPPPAEPPPYEPPPPPADSDGDHLTDAQETDLGSNLYNPDSDYDGITDADEVNITDTSPTSTDSDNDGVTDYNAFYGNFQVNTFYAGEGYSPSDWDGDGISDPSDPDPFSPTNDPDSDGDYLPDSQDSDPGVSWLWNDWNHNGTNDDAENTTNDWDGDGVADDSDSDPLDAWL